MTDRPKRRAPTLATKLAVCERALKQLWDCDALEYDHVPGLWQREVNTAGSDYIPPQNDPDSLFVKPKAEHRQKTSGNGATSYGSDSHARAKEDRITGKTKRGPKKAIPKRVDPWPPKGSRSLPSRPMRKEGRHG